MSAVCPKCHSEWPEPCEQSIAIAQWGECVACKFSILGSNTGTERDLAWLGAEGRKQRGQPPRKWLMVWGGETADAEHWACQ